MKGRIEKWLFDRYKYWMKRQMSMVKSGVTSHWEVIEEIERILIELYDYDFPFCNGHGLAIKNGKKIFEYDLN